MPSKTPRRRPSWRLRHPPSGRLRPTGLPLLLLLLLAPAVSAQTPTLVVEIEGGPAWQSYNDVEIPNDGSATRFSVDELTGHGPWAAGRLYVTWNLAERHGLRVLLAPFSLTETGTPTGDVDFAGARYVAGTPLDATYTFNSYRLTYRYRFRRSERWTAWVGLTAKIRDATIALEQGSIASRKDDLGFVPLLHFGSDWRLASGWSVDVDVDALAGGPGRAVDAALELERDLGDGWSAQLGYRTVEGGADVTEVYTFAWLHYAVASVRFSL